MVAPTWHVDPVLKLLELCEQTRSDFIIDENLRNSARHLLTALRAAFSRLDGTGDGVVEQVERAISHLKDATCCLHEPFSNGCSGVQTMNDACKFASDSIARSRVSRSLVSVLLLPDEPTCTEVDITYPLTLSNLSMWEQIRDLHTAVMSLGTEDPLRRHPRFIVLCERRETAAAGLREKYYQYHSMNVHTNVSGMNKCFEEDADEDCIAEGHKAATALKAWAQEVPDGAESDYELVVDTAEEAREFTVKFKEAVRQEVDDICLSFTATVAPKLDADFDWSHSARIIKTFPSCCTFGPCIDELGKLITNLKEAARRLFTAEAEQLFSQPQHMFAQHILSRPSSPSVEAFDHEDVTTAEFEKFGKQCLKFAIRWYSEEEPELEHRSFDGEAQTVPLSLTCLCTGLYNVLSPLDGIDINLNPRVRAQRFVDAKKRFR